MNSADIRGAAAAAGLEQAVVCGAVGIVIPLLEKLKARQKGGIFSKDYWIGVALGVVIGALRAYRADECGA